jgi:hypothetical protein
LLCFSVQSGANLNLFQPQGVIYFLIRRAGLWQRKVHGHAVSLEKLKVRISPTKFLLLPDAPNIHLPIQVHNPPGENQFIATETVYSTLEPT